MFRALRLFPAGVNEATLAAPVSEGGNQPPVTLGIHPQAIFATTVGASSKMTLASWHVTTSQEIVSAMLQMQN